MIYLGPFVLFMGSALCAGFSLGFWVRGVLVKRDERAKTKRDREYDQFCKLQRIEIRLKALEARP